eukprot:CAMPEP_0197185932 /NCGR_PEP_ID=MMETSP1423-20130617/12916_1 /TAXON_ID=476441 /ORGANISM="Pseudo-nitzschia heimii, Strain UNC1101" /LENGTH=759 /DNA_ID=CAMNT_0042637113 /DNA_START=75 /DNA_END=2354 /DNA_ORIENTATION=-
MYEREGKHFLDEDDDHHHHHHDDGLRGPIARSSSDINGNNNNNSSNVGIFDGIRDSYRSIGQNSAKQQQQQQQSFRSSRDGYGGQIKPNQGRQVMRSYDLSGKNRRAADQRKIEIKDVWECPENSKEDIAKSILKNGVQMKMFNQTKESFARSGAESNKVRLFLEDLAGAVLVIARHLITIESVFSCLLSTVTTFLLYMFHADWEVRRSSSGGFDGVGGEGKPSSYGKSMSFLILSFFLIMPITTLLRITYLRREQAIRHLGKMKACANAIYQCHATWTWTYKDETSKRLDRLEHSDECLHLLIDFADTMTRFLTLPMTGYPRHREIKKGRGEEELTIAAAYALFETSVSEYGTKLGMLTEVMKEHGFSASEASRVRQSERMLLEAAEFLREGKLYRTPQSMNALITFFAIFGPSFYGPAFAQIAYDFGSVWFGVCYAAVISLALTALYEAVKLMEDPFVGYTTIDGIDVFEELSIVYYLQLLRARETIFPGAPTFGANSSLRTSEVGNLPKDHRHRRNRSGVSMISRGSHHDRSHSLRASDFEGGGGGDHHHQSVEKHLPPSSSSTSCHRRSWSGMSVALRASPLGTLHKRAPSHSTSGVRFDTADDEIYPSKRSSSSYNDRRETPSVQLSYDDRRETPSSVAHERSSYASEAMMAGDDIESGSVIVFSSTDDAPSEAQRREDERRKDVLEKEDLEDYLGKQYLREQFLRDKYLRNKFSAAVPEKTKDDAPPSAHKDLSEKDAPLHSDLLDIQDKAVV